MKHLTKLTALLLALLLILSLLPFSALAAGGSVAAQSDTEDNSETTIIDSGKCGDYVTWRLTDDGVLTISGVGEMRGRSSADKYPWYSYHEIIKKVIISSGVPKVTERAFDGYPALTEVYLSEGVTRISPHAFENCIALRDVHLPDSLKYIDSYAFSECTSLLGIYLPPALLNAGSGAFRYCTSLKTATITCSCRLNATFNHCTSLTNVAFLNEVPELYRSFGYCSSLKEITLPEGCERLYETFRFCTSLERVIFPLSIKQIDTYSFRGCTALTDKYYPGSYEQWKQVEIADGNTYLKRAKLHSYFKFIPYCEVSEPKYSVYAYTGQKIKPTITVKTANGTTLKKGTNYTVSYEENIYPGTATIKITGIGKYSGTAYRFFRIRANKLQGLRIKDGGADTATVKWTEDPQAVRYQVYLDSNLAGETTDTELVLSDLDGKSHDIEVRSIWKGPSDSGDVEEHIGLSAKVRLNSIADCRCTRRYSYYHSTRTPPVTVKTQKGTLLKKGLNYTVSYQRTEETDGYGTPMYRITITGIGKYYGVHDLYFYYGRRPKASYGGDA